MTLSKLASEIAKREGKKSQARIGDIREILGVLSDIMLEDPNTLYVVTTEEGVVDALFKTGQRRAKRRGRK